MFRGIFKIIKGGRVLKKISVIIPSYKPNQYLFECLDSLENQTLEKKYFEVIVIINGPKEPYYSHLIDSKKNYNLDLKCLYCNYQGVSNARNMGLDTALGENICFIDDDDFVSNNYLESLLDLKLQESIVISNLLCFTDEKDTPTLDYVGHSFMNNINIVSDNIVSMRKFLSNACGKLIPSEIIGKVRFNPNFSIGEDSMFMAMISKNIKNFITTNQEVVYYRRLTMNSASRKKRNKWFYVKNACIINKEFTKLLFKRGYHPIFIMTRMLAQVKKIK